MIFLFLAGAIVMGFMVISLFFLRYWIHTKEKLFGIFAFAFFIMGIERGILAYIYTLDEIYSLVYLVRLVAFLLIIYGIVDKNKSTST